MASPSRTPNSTIAGRKYFSSTSNKSFTIALSFSAIALLLPLSATTAYAAKDTITLGMVLEPPHLDPTAGAAAAIDEVVYANIFEGLTRIDQDGGVQPDLADSWEITPDGKVYTFKLHPGVKFHDGSDMNAEDVKFSLDRAMDAKGENAQKGLFEAIEKVEVVDPATVKISLKQPAGNLLYNLGWGDAVIVASETAANNKTTPVGTGPFKFSKWNKGNSIELMRNDAYWGKPVALKSATFRIIPDPAAAVSSLLAEDVDAFPMFPAPESLPQFQADPRFAVVIGSTEGETILAINNKKKPFDDLRVRQALCHAIDRKAIIDGAMFGQGTPIGSHFSPANPAYVDLTGAYPYDPEKAKQLLADAGLKDGFKATLKLPPPPYARRGGEIIAAQLRKVGIDAQLVSVEWADWLDKVFKGKDYDMTIVSHVEPMDIGIYARPDYYFQYENADFRAIMDKLSMTVDPTERNNLLGEAQKKISADSVNCFLFQLAKPGVWNAKIEGLWKNQPIPANDLTAVMWKD